MKKITKLSWILFILVFGAEASAGYYVNHVRQLISGDAISRVANAFYVIYTTPPHLASIGMVWTPLPSLLELPLMLLWPLYHPIASSALAGVILTSFFAALTSVLLFKTFVEYRHSITFSVFCVLLYSFNPYIFLYGLNGMSEILFCFMMIWSIINLVKWMEDKRTYYAIRIAAALALAFLSRYEASTFTVGIAICVVVILLFSKEYDHLEGKRKLREKYYLIESNLVIFMMPVAYSVIIWLAYNYLITGNALYFLNSAYSNLGQSGGILNDSALAAIYHNPVGVLAYVLGRTSYFILPALLILLKRLFTGKVFKKDFLVFLILLVSTEILQCFLLFTGKSAAWLRYFMYPLPVTAAWLPYEFRTMKNAFLKYAGVFLVFAASGVLAFYVLVNPVKAPDQFNVFGNNQGNLSIQIQNQIAEYINQTLPDATILMDTFTTFSVVLNSEHPQKFIVSSSLIFNAAIRHPKENGVQYILIPNPKDPLGSLDAVNIYYPGLYDNGSSFCVLQKEFRDYRLYKVM
jgi:4-amino-4-deoxy-L-arabinose transferase-like glycosyltransferase